jgi:hypothetical protein
VLGDKRLAARIARSQHLNFAIGQSATNNLLKAQS